MATGRVNEGRLEVVTSDVAKLRPLALASASLDPNCKPAPKIDKRPASNVDHAKARQALNSHREISLEPWSVFDAS
jgi:hypothetical protein